VTDDSAALWVNGSVARLQGMPDDERLLDTLRWRLGLKGTKEGCRTGDCGACTVLVDGKSTLSCLTLTREVEGGSVTTIDGASDDPELKRVSAAFTAAEALQCGYCTPGFVVALAGLLKERGRSAPVEELMDGLQGNLCRCTGYAAIARAVALAREDAP
jgi:aerobic carbon-monoxide dehydrogenase small subunit